MTAEEYSSLETQATTALQRFRENGINGDDIGILMSREVYDMAKSGGNPAYAVSIENFRAVYWGYDIYVINENSPPIFSPVLMRFSENCDLHQFDAGTFLISESDDGTLQVYAKSTREPAFFCETEFTAHQACQTERVTFADRIRAGQERERQRRWYERSEYLPRYDWVDYFPDGRSQPDLFRFTTPSLSMEEFERQLNEVAAMTQREFLDTPLRKKKAPPKKDWDERITPEDTKELDEFLNSLARKGTLESAT